MIVNKKTIYLGLNLIIPGIAQAILKKWIRAFLMFFGALACFAATAYEALRPLIKNICALLSDSYAPLEEVSWSYVVSVLVPLSLLVLIWVWGILDVIFICGKDNNSNMEKNKDEIPKND